MTIFFYWDLAGELLTLVDKLEDALGQLVTLVDKSYHLGSGSWLDIRQQTSFVNQHSFPPGSQVHFVNEYL